MTSELLSKYLQQYSPEEVVKSYEKNEFPLANDSYIVDTNQGNKYVIRVLRCQSRESAETESVIQGLLKIAGIGTAEYLQFVSGGTIGSENGALFTISRFIEGAQPQSITIELIRDIGATLARIHDTIDQSVLNPDKREWLSIENARKEIDLIPAYSDLLQKLKDSHEKLSGLPKSVIHGDLFDENMFANESAVTVVFDFGMDPIH